MKRTLLVLIAGAVLLGTGVPNAMATKQDRVIEQEQASLADIRAFLDELAQTKATLQEAQAVVNGTLTREQKQQCQFNSMNPTVSWTNREERRTAWCATQKWSVPGGFRKFIAVGDCESSWYRFAYNPNGHAGLFQHDTDYWPGRVRHYEPRGWELKENWTNSRSQIVVTARMVHNNGSWTGWTCA